MSTAPSMHDGLTLFTRLLATPSPSGFEERIAGVLRSELERIGWPIEQDAAGNLLVRISGTDAARTPVWFAAHMDEIGMTVTQVYPDGSLGVGRLGGLLPWKIGESPVVVLGDAEDIVGVLSLGSGHSRRAVDAGPSWESARILTGRSPTSVAASGVRVGSPAVPTADVRGPIVFGDADAPWIGAWTFDNRLGITACIQALKTLRASARRPRSSLTVAFTVQEEIGCHGAKALAVREQPEILIAVDGSPLVPECPVPLDGRPAIRSRDRLATYDQELLRKIRAIASDVGVDMETVVYDGAASDASAVFAAGACPRVACLGYVRASSHGFEVTPLKTFDTLSQTLAALFLQL